MNLICVLESFLSRVPYLIYLVTNLARSFWVQILCLYFSFISLKVRPRRSVGTVWWPLSSWSSRIVSRAVARLMSRRKNPYRYAVVLKIICTHKYVRKCPGWAPDMRSPTFHIAYPLGVTYEGLPGFPTGSVEKHHNENMVRMK